MSAKSGNGQDPSLGSTTDYLEPSKQAYESAKIYFLDHLGTDNVARQLVEHSHSISEVLSVVHGAEKHYKAKRGSKAYKWLVRVSEKVGYYGTVLDVLVQHHPEYVSLVWGTFKLLFGAICSHEEQVKQLAKTCAQIGNILENVEIRLSLYTSERLIKSVSELYVNILEFLKHAVAWYAKSRFGRAWTAISRPWELGFRDYVQDIKSASNRIVELVMMSSQADIRALSLKTDQMYQELASNRLQFERMSIMMQQMYSMQTQLQADYSSSMGVIRRMEHNQILSLPMMASLPASGQSMNFCRSIRDRRRQRYYLPAPTIRQFEEWSKGPDSSIIFTLARSAQASQDFMVDSIKLIQEEKRNIVWAMRFERHWEKPLSCIDVLKVLVRQCLQINTEILKNDPFPPTAASFLEAVDERDWLQILNRVVRGLPVLYIALDVTVIRNALGNDGLATVRFLEDLTRTVSSTTIKIILEQSAIDGDYVRRTWDRSLWSVARIDGSEGGKRKPGASSLRRMQIKRRRRR
ncbi:hypothetical protein PFICI_04775 [Pestalotiopsis fici W106-1]|uniref:DUF7708 domain-containing protein n=1 Tax=Pestalotiopsis fici (strain W106-1 / CGMCC3.15140) TaxID=1229662 RepID=W3XA42_PESFW|nr:uncharacterized protein PFICI_04775 [Pestalotiopsis fici W106-1]ETS82899.1 hypothetical protein PFICI_04775 [Pestalotiopsis fici W106-1]